MERIPKKYPIRFITPAFLGDANQNGVWRTPPFKALIRQWWRVVKAGGKPIDPKELLDQEGALFGQALDDQKNNISQVRIKLDLCKGTCEAERWKKYQFSNLTHPEVNSVRPKSDLYLGYGPVLPGGKIKGKTFIPPSPQNEVRNLVVSIPKKEEQTFNEVFKLIHLFGTVGGRSRNGWGSLALENVVFSKEEILEIFTPENRKARDWLRDSAVNWETALEMDWCYALGWDGMEEQKNLLLWRTRNYNSWEKVMDKLGKVKIMFRTQFIFDPNNTNNALEKRHILAYPVTKHPYINWGNQGRSANQICFKVHEIPEGYIGLVYHLPHGLPQPLRDKLTPNDKNQIKNLEREVWSDVHNKLNQELTRLP